MHKIEAREVVIATLIRKEIPLVSMSLRRDSLSDQNRFHAPTSSEVSMMLVNEDGEPPFKRGFILWILIKNSLICTF